MSFDRRVGAAASAKHVVNEKPVTTVVAAIAKHVVNETAATTGEIVK